MSITNCTSGESRNSRRSVRWSVVWVVLFASAFGAGSRAYADKGSGTVRIIYLVPSDRPARIDYLNVTTAAAEHLREWLWDAIGDSETFALNTPVVELVRTPHEASWYVTHSSGREPPLWFWDNVLSDGFALTGAIFDDPRFRWVFYIDSENAPGQVTGAAAGVAVLPQHDLLGLIGQTPEPVCRWVGGLGHELGHALGLPHPPECEGPTGDQSRPNCQSLMYLGYLTYPNTFLTTEDIDRLRQNPFIVASKRPHQEINCADLLAAAPTIDDVELRGERLFIFGHNFVRGSTIMVNDEAKVTSLRDNQSTTVLIGHVNSHRPSSGEAVRVRVVNPDGMSTDEIFLDIPLR
jgi:hypothetical protein